MSQGLHLFLQALGMSAGAVILHNVLAAIDAMDKDTHHGVRTAFLLLGTGGFAQIVDPWLSSAAASGGDLLLTCGLALLLIFDRRCVACPRSVAIGALRRRRDEHQPNGETGQI